VSDLCTWLIVHVDWYRFIGTGLDMLQLDVTEAAKGLSFIKVRTLSF
jgi:hypothetical protein